jgi:uncharacterized membrane protein
MSNDASEAAGHSSDHASGLRLATLARNHGLVFLVAILLFAATDTWNAASGLLIAQLLCVMIAALAGITITSLVHEWFHYWGARFARAQINIPKKQGLFVYAWDFGRNSTGQFLIMSIAGTIGSFLAVALLWSTVPADSLGRAVLRSAAVGSVIYSAMIEWPVIRRAMYSDNPLGELSKIDKALLTRSFIVASLSGIASTVLLVY